MTALINGTLMTTLILNGSNRILVWDFYNANHKMIDVRKTLTLLYSTSSGACTMCSGIHPFYYYGGVMISRLCIVQHSMFGVMLNLLLLIHFHFILFISWLGHHFIFAMSLRTLQWCFLCNYKFRKNKSPSESHNRNCSNRVFLHKITANIACKNIEFLEYIMKLCIAGVHRIIQGKKVMAV
jgi:hypothetical protein